MKTIAIGDCHGRNYWMKIVDKEKADRVVFIGDYFDTHQDISPAEQMYNFQEIIRYKEEGSAEVILLIGNHDYHYFPEIGYTGTSGYQERAATAITVMIMENRKHLQMAYKMDDFLFTHAGLSNTFWIKANKHVNWNEYNGHGDASYADILNVLFEYKPRVFDFHPQARDYSGDDVYQSPIWIRPKSLMKDNYDTLRKEIIQVVGHTQQKQIDIEGKATGSRYYFIDTLGTSGEYLIIKDGKITTGQI